MELGSLQFDVFLILALLLYWVRDRQKWRRSVLIVADFCFVLLCGIKSLLWCAFFVLMTYALGRVTETAQNRKRAGLLSGCLVLLCLFLAGYLLPAVTQLSLFAAAGMSYYALSLAGYLFDLGKGNCERASLCDLALFAGNFAAFLSGPVQFSGSIRQYRELPSYDNETFCEGLLLILWGFFEKTVVANCLALSVDFLFGQIATTTPARLLLSSLFYSFQLYCDFAGYSNIAIGLGKLFGVTVPENFRAPYLATNIQDFWRRWHIGLSSWFREYLYFPLGGSRKGLIRTALNVLIVFTVSGLWHGFGLNFLFWGALHGAALAAFTLIRPFLQRHGMLERTEKNPVLRWIARILNFAFVNLAWIFFRSPSLMAGIDFLSRFREKLEFPSYILTTVNLPEKKIVSIFAGLALIFIVDLLHEHGKTPEKTISRSPVLRMVVYLLLFAAIAFCGNFEVSGSLYYNF